MKDRETCFWLTIGSLITGILVLVFILFMGAKEQIQFNKEYCLCLLPILIYLIFQFVINYSNLIDEDENKRIN